MQKFLLLAIFLFFTSGVCAEGLSAQEIQRLEAVKQLLGGVNTQSLQQMMSRLHKSRYPAISLQMQEAMARAYSDIVTEENVLTPQKKKWLYSMVCLNMAYLQFEGTSGLRERTTALNKLIRIKLKEYLPVNIYKQPGFLYSL